MWVLVRDSDGWDCNPNFPVTPGGSYPPVGNCGHFTYLFHFRPPDQFLLGTYLPVPYGFLEEAMAMDVDAMGRVCVAGYMTANFSVVDPNRLYPVTPDAFDPEFGPPTTGAEWESIANEWDWGISTSSPVDAFLTCYRPAGDIFYSTYLGGQHTDAIVDLRFVPDGSLLVAGFSNSPDFPTTSGVFRGSYPGTEAFATFVSRFVMGNPPEPTPTPTATPAPPSSWPFRLYLPLITRDAYGW